MKQLNKLSLPNYISYHIYWHIWCMLAFQYIAFHKVGTLTLTQSKVLLVTLVLAISVISIGLTYKKRRNHLSLMTNIILPYEIYTIIAYRKIMSWQLHVGIAFAVILSIVLACLIFSNPISNTRKKREIIRKRCKHYLVGVRAITSWCLLLSFSTIFLGTVLNTSLVKSSVEPEVGTENDLWTIANNVERLSPLIDGTWVDLKVGEKANVMQIIANIEVQYLGLPHELTVTIVPMEEHIMANYNDQTHTIKVNLEHFATAEPDEIIESLCHEAYHSYQHRLVDLYDNTDDEYKNMSVFSKALIYKNEFANYIDGEEDYWGYALQSCELTARIYSKDAVEDYREKIAMYLNEGTKFA